MNSFLKIWHTNVSEKAVNKVQDTIFVKFANIYIYMSQKMIYVIFTTYALVTIQKIGFQVSSTLHITYVLFEFLFLFTKGMRQFHVEPRKNRPRSGQLQNYIQWQRSHFPNQRCRPFLWSW